MRITIKLFANLKDLAGTDSVEIEVADGIKVAELATLIADRYPPLKDILETRRVFISVNQEMARKEDALKEGDEVGLLPPFSGG